MEPDDLLCSRNARPLKALVGRAQWKINQPPSLKRERASLEGSLHGDPETHPASPIGKWRRERDLKTLKPQRL